MPELPEVEQFRKLLLPLKQQHVHGAAAPVIMERDPRHHRIDENVDTLSGQCCCVDVLRRGKQICMVLQDLHVPERLYYVYIHMGMSGRISSPTQHCRMGSVQLAETMPDFPPQYTYLLWRCNGYQVSFSDSRKFGKVHVAHSLDDLESLAPDAHDCTMDDAMVQGLANKGTAVKALLLDQRKLVSGVGNWVADEVLYQVGMHPDQTHLSVEQAQQVLRTMQDILRIAVDCLARDDMYPAEWLFSYRWTGKKAGSLDAQGRGLTFVTSAGRTSAIVASQQRLYKRPKTDKAKKTAKKSVTVSKKETVKKHRSTTTTVRTTTAMAATVLVSSLGRRRSPRLVSP